MYTKIDIIDWLEKLEAQDDVSDAHFRKRLMFCGTVAGAIRLDQDLVDYLSAEGIQYIVAELETSVDEGPITGGPYLWANERLNPVYKFYDDTYGAFLQPLRQSSDDKYVFHAD